MSVTLSTELSWLIELTRIDPKALDDTQPQGGTKVPSHKEKEAKKRAALAELLEKEDDEIERTKQLAIADVIRVLKPLKPALKDYYDFEITDAEGETFQAQAKTGDLAKTGDSSDLAGGGTFKGRNTGMTSEQLIKEVTRAQNIMITLQKQLEQKTYSRLADCEIEVGKGGKEEARPIKGDPERLFTDDEITEELYTPLIREKIIAPHFIQDKFSRAQKMIDGSNKLYKAELKNSTVKENDNVANLLKLAVGTGSAMVSSVLALDGIDTKMAQELLTGGTELVNLTIDFGDKARAGVDVKSVTNFLNGLPSVVGDIVGSALGNSELGSLVTVAASTATQGIGLIANAIKTKKPDPQALFQFASTLINVGLNEKASQQDNDKAMDVYTLGETLSTAFGDAVGKQAGAFYEAAAAGDSKRMRQVLMGALQDVVVNQLPKLAAPLIEIELASSTESTDSKKTNLEINQIVHGESDLSQSDQEEVLAEAKKEKHESSMSGIGDTVAETIGGVGETYDGLKESKEQAELKKKAEELFKTKAEQLEKDSEEYEKKREELDEELKKHPEKLAESMRKDIEKERAEFNKKLKELNDPSVDFKTIDKLMADIRRDRAIMGMAVAIGKGGFEVASKFLAPLSIGNEAIKMAMNIKAVVERAADLRAFVDESIGATNAVSEYLSSVQCFVDQQDNQLDQYSIRIALNAANIAASIAATVCPIAAPAVTVAGAAQSAAELIFAVQSEARVRKAWAMTKKVLANPRNRRLALQVRKFNPTLAKYTIAYGAMIESDPIAMSMCDACGIDNDALKNEGSNAQKVKDFLELKFNEDDKVSFKYEDPPTWVDKLPDAQLTPGCVLHTYKVIADGFAQDGSEATQKKLQQVGAIAPEPKDLVSLVKQVSEIDVVELEKEAAPTGKEEPYPQIKANLMMIDRVVNGFRAESARFAPLGADASNAVAAFGELAEPLQSKVVMMLLKKVKI